MANLVVGDKLEVRVYVALGDQLAINTLHYRVSAVAGTSTDQQQAALDLDVALEADYKDAMGTGAGYRGLTAMILKDVPEVPSVANLNAGAGTDAGQLLPRVTCGIIAYRTALRGRSHQGRIFVPGATETFNGGDALPTAGYLTLLSNLANAIEGPITVGVGANTATLKFGVYHRNTNTVEDVTRMIVRPYWGRQKRRSDTGRQNTIPF